MSGRIVSILLGVWLMMAPTVLGFGGSSAIDDRVVAPLIVALSLIACHAATRNLRWLVAGLGLWLALSAGLLDPQALVSRLCSLDVGLLIIGASVAPYGRPVRLAGGWPTLIWRLLERRAASERLMPGILIWRTETGAEVIDSQSNQASE